jgi:hypothetical protein
MKGGNALDTEQVETSIMSRSTYVEAAAGCPPLSFSVALKPRVVLTSQSSLVLAAAPVGQSDQNSPALAAGTGRMSSNVTWWNELQQSLAVVTRFIQHPLDAMEPK